MTTNMADDKLFTPGKRNFPSDHEESLHHQMQSERNTRQKQNDTDNDTQETFDTNIDLSSNPEVFDNPTPVQKISVGELTQIVANILCEPTFITKITSIISSQIANKIDAACKESIKPYVEKTSQQDTEIQSLKEKVATLERGLEEQQQYSRRTSLRFNNVKLPTDHRGNIIFPVETDTLAVDICNSVTEPDSISLDDIGRTHTIGKIKNGSASIIVRFLSYRKRHLVYSNKRKLKDHPNKTFISENLTQTRFDLVRKLNIYRKKRMLDSYWTQDGRIIVKPRENCDRRDFVTITCLDDFFHKLNLPRSVLADHEAELLQTASASRTGNK